MALISVITNFFYDARSNFSGLCVFMSKFHFRFCLNSIHFVVCVCFFLRVNFIVFLLFFSENWLQIKFHKTQHYEKRMEAHPILCCWFPFKAIHIKLLKTFQAQNKKICISYFEMDWIRIESFQMMMMMLIINIQTAEHFLSDTKTNTIMN